MASSISLRGLRSSRYVFVGLRTCIAHQNSPIAYYQFPYPLATSIDGTKIRLLDIQPGRSPEPLRCTLVEVSLTTEVAPFYSAISYEWGPSVVFVTIFVNDKPFGIRPNLWTFLTRLRSPDDRVVVWVDAVCINQQDLAERSAQVGRMAETYSQASQVLVWLGAKETNIGKATQAMTEMLAETDVDFAELLLDTVVYQDDSDDGKNLSRYVRAHEILAYICKPEYTLSRLRVIELCKATLGLCERTYWSRTWTIQELVLAKDKTLYAGSATVPWKLFRLLYDMVSTFALRHGSGMDRTSREQLALSGFKLDDRPIDWDPDEEEVISKCSLLLASPASISQKHSRGDLFQLLIATVKTECSDRRDKVYGLLGIASNRAELPLPDYSKHCADLLLDIAACYRENTIEIASYLRHAFNLTRNERAVASRSPHPRHEFSDRLTFCAEVVMILYVGKTHGGPQPPLKFVLLHVPNKDVLFGEAESMGEELTHFSLRKENSGHISAIVDGDVRPGDEVYRLPFSTAHVVMGRLQGQCVDDVHANVVGRLYPIDTAHKYQLPLSRVCVDAVDVRLVYNQGEGEGLMHLRARFGKELLLEAAEIHKTDDATSC